MADLETRTLGRTGLEVTALGFGAMELRGPPTGPEVSDDDAGKLLNAVLDEGITFIDTSIDYGRSEELIGKFISSRRSEYALERCPGDLLLPDPMPRRIPAGPRGLGGEQAEIHSHRTPFARGQDLGEAVILDSLHPLDLGPPARHVVGVGDHLPNPLGRRGHGPRTPDGGHQSDSEA